MVTSVLEPVRTGASMNRGRSKQDYQTPREFIDAVERRFGKLSYDLAASKENAVCPEYYDEESNALGRDWHALSGNLWCNPPFGAIAPWARKAATEAGPCSRVLLLVPASVGSHWFADHVLPHAMVYALSPRLSFDGKNAFPKDLILAAYGFGVSGFAVWRWR